MARKRSRAGLDGILNLDSLVDVVTNTNGMLILLAVFTTLLVVGKAYILSFPVARVSDQKPVFFECRGDRVTLVSVAGRYSDTYYVVPIGSAELVIPLDETYGENSDELRWSGSLFRRQAAEIDPSIQHAAFLVRPDGFEAFLAAREAIIELHPEIRVGWEPMPLERPLMFGPGGRSIKVQ